MSLIQTPASYRLQCNACGRWLERGYTSRARLMLAARSQGWNARRALCLTCKTRKKTSVKKHFDKPPLLAGQVEG